MSRKIVSDVSRTALVAVLALAAQPALANTEIVVRTTAPLKTSVSGNINVTKDGSIIVPGGTAVQIDSNSNVTNAGTIDAGPASGAIGIILDAGRTSTITNSGTITVTESFSVADADGNGIADGPVASASGRYGIRVMPGAATGGSIINTGTIQVDGLNSAGIAVDSNFTGSLSSTGTITMLGDYSVGIRTQAVTGDVTVGGQVNVIGEGAVGVSLGGDIGGRVILRGSINQTQSFRTDDGRNVSLSRADLSVGAPAVDVAGNVAGGLVIESTGALQSYGNGAALRIGAASDLTIGRVTGNTAGRSLVIDGAIRANGPYTATDVVGVSLGGRGGRVTLNGSIGVGGTIQVNSFDGSATAILINSGVTAPSLYNSGTISAQMGSSGQGPAYAIRDLSGSLTTIENTKFISARGSGDGASRAIDLSAATTGVTIRQFLNEADAKIKADKEAKLPAGERDTTIYASITGDIVTGSGNDLISANTGTMIGNIFLNNGNDRVELAGDALISGRLFFGNGSATMTMAAFSGFRGNADFAGQQASLTLEGSSSFLGTLSGSSNLAVTVNGGTFGANGINVLAMNSLTVGSGGTINVFVDGKAGTNSVINANTATFASGAKISATIVSLETAVGRYTFLNAGQLSGVPQFAADATSLPYLFAGSVSALGNSLELQIRRKTLTELGISQAAGAAVDALVVAAPNDRDIAASFLNVKSKEALQTLVDQALPDHAGGIFDSVTQASRAARRHVTDISTWYQDWEIGAWLEPIYWRNNKNAGATAKYRSSGWGLSTGFERYTKLGNFGLSYAYISGSVTNNGGSGEIKTGQHELGAFWRIKSGGFHAFARAGAARVSMDSTRTITASNGTANFSRISTADWNGWLYTGSVGAAYEVKVSDNFVVTPRAIVDYNRMSESAYTEAGGGKAVDYAVKARTSTSTTISSTLLASYRTSAWNADGRPLTIELEGGRRSRLSGALGGTTASLNGGTLFTIQPEALSNEWLAEARVLIGGWDHTMQVSARAERSGTQTGYSASASLTVAF